MNSTQWFKSSYSDAQGNGDCVRVSFTHLATTSTVLIGDTKTRTPPSPSPPPPGPTSSPPSPTVSSARRDRRSGCR
ncbi:DUF397 domain-containing protein [Kitasatospora sp. NPDC094015]|uniref:DUF397 domain-containing protein n=1 Tax=Kitasatospora sp. NPDC094015 TaxID=3155205 RepID=UPI00332D6390